MAMIVYTERILDLGEHGVLALTLGAASYAPLPAHLHGYARWHTPTGEAVDCASLCFRAIASEDMRATIERLRAKAVRAVASVRGFHDWLAGQIADLCLDAPTDAVALSQGRVLLVFGSEQRPHALRLIDVPGRRVVWESPVPAVRSSLGIAKPTFDVLDSVLVHAAAGEHVLLGLGDKPALVRVGEQGLERVPLAGAPDWLEGEFVADHFVARERDSLRLHFLALRDVPSARFEPKGKASADYYVHLATARRGDRVALSYEGGLVEIVEAAGTRSRLFRPLLRAGGKDMVGMSFSPNGRYAVATLHEQARLIDWETATAADVALPQAQGGSYEPHVFVPEVHYRPGWAVTDRGGYVVEGGQLTFTLFDALAWQPFDPDGASAAAPDARLAKLCLAWTRSALSLEPAKKGVGASHLYGAPVLGGNWSWPEHDGVPMWLLCELDLAQVHALAPGMGLPPAGALLFFVAVDAEGEPLMRENSFDPAAVQVLHVTSAALAGTVQRDNPWAAIAEQPLMLRPDVKSDWPQADAAVVRAAELSDAQLARYHALLEAHAPDGAAAGHRLGGYPHLLQSNILEVQADALSRGLELDSPQLTWEAAAGWRLLLQLDSDDVYMWGTDSGMLYFMIRDDDLERADFSRVVALTAGF